MKLPDAPPPQLTDEPIPAVTVQVQPTEADLVPVIDPPRDHATGTLISVIKEGGAGEQFQMTDTLPQPEPIEVVPTPGTKES